MSIASAMQSVPNIYRSCVLCGHPTDRDTWICSHCRTVYALVESEEAWPNGVRKVVNRHRDAIVLEQKADDDDGAFYDEDEDEEEGEEFTCEVCGHICRVCFEPIEDVAIILDNGEYTRVPEQYCPKCGTFLNDMTTFENETDQWDDEDAESSLLPSQRGVWAAWEELEWMGVLPGDL